MAAGSKIPLFDRGKFIGTRTFSTIEALLTRGLVRISYSSKGYVVRPDRVHLAQINTGPTDQRLFSSPTIPPVTRYSFRDAAVAAKPWDLKRLNGSRTGINYASGANPTDFIGVVGSCLELLPFCRHLANCVIIAAICRESRICNCFTRVPPVD